MPVGVPGVVPAVVAPVLDADDEVERAVAVVVGVAPLVVPHLRALRLRCLAACRSFAATGSATLLGRPVVVKVGILAAGREHAQLAVDVARHDVVHRAAQPAGGLEDRKLVLRRVARRVLEQPDAVRRLVGAGDDQVEIAVAVGVARHGPGPQADAQIDDQARDGCT